MIILKKFHMLVYHSKDKTTVLILNKCTVSSNTVLASSIPLPTDFLWPPYAHTPFPLFFNTCPSNIPWRPPFPFLPLNPAPHMDIQPKRLW